MYSATVGIIFLKRTNSIPLDGLVVKKELVNVGFVNDLVQRTGLEVTGIEVQQSAVNTGLSYYVAMLPYIDHIS